MTQSKQLTDDFDDGVLFSPPPVVKLPVLPQSGDASNPLHKYYRVPGLHVNLSTRGAFLPPGTYLTTMTGELPVYPMTAKDELLLKSPDALMSGYAIEQLLLSCVPNVKTPRLISTPDLDVLLLSIRCATYGPTMEINTTCPKCDNNNSFDCDLPTLLSTMTFVEPENVVRLSDEIVVYVRPYNLANATKAAMASFEETRNMQALADATNEEKTSQMNRSMSRLTKLNIDILADCIIKVIVPEAIVTDRKQIVEFIDNVNRVWVQKIEEKVKEINAKGVDKKIHIKCEAVIEEDGKKSPCGHEFDTEVEFDPANFFAGES